MFRGYLGKPERAISILAPLAGRDEIIRLDHRHGGGISILAPLAGRDLEVAVDGQGAHVVFQSSRPLRGATSAPACLTTLWAFQSSRPLRGATIPDLGVSAQPGISILAPLAGRDLSRGSTPLASTKRFQSSRPLRGATPLSPPSGTLPAISILAPLAGRDGLVLYCACSSRDFNPRAPCGARRLSSRCSNRHGSISILAPLAGRDPVFPLQNPPP